MSGPSTSSRLENSGLSPRSDPCTARWATSARRARPPDRRRRVASHRRGAVSCRDADVGDLARGMLEDGPATADDTRARRQRRAASPVPHGGRRRHDDDAAPAATAATTTAPARAGRSARRRPRESGSARGSGAPASRSRSASAAASPRCRRTAEAGGHPAQQELGAVEARTVRRGTESRRARAPRGRRDHGQHVVLRPRRLDEHAVAGPVQRLAQRRGRRRGRSPPDPAAWRVSRTTCRSRPADSRGAGSGRRSERSASSRVRDGHPQPASAVASSGSSGGSAGGKRRLAARRVRPRSGPVAEPPDACARSPSVTMPHALARGRRAQLARTDEGALLVEQIPRRRAAAGARRHASPRAVGRATRGAAPGCAPRAGRLRRTGAADGRGGEPSCASASERRASRRDAQVQGRGAATRGARAPLPCAGGWRAGPVAHELRRRADVVGQHQPRARPWARKCAPAASAYASASSSEPARSSACASPSWASADIVVPARALRVEPRDGARRRRRRPRGRAPHAPGCRRGRATRSGRRRAR